MLNSQLTPATSNRIPRCWALRTQLGAQDAFIPAGAQIDNGDEALYADKSGTYTKGILQTAVGLVDLAAYDSFKKALASGDPADFVNIVLGPGKRTLNGPQGGIAFYLQCPDADAFSAPPAPAVASEAYATELVELYWASLLRDVAFTDYPMNSVAKKAAMELSGLPAYAGPRDSTNQVTPELLFRGGVGNTTMFHGETIGPYISQFLLLPADFGALVINQKYATNQSHADFMLTANEFLTVQNGGVAGALNPQPPVYMHNGRGLAAYTHIDVLYQAYFIAYLVLNSGLRNNKMVPWKLNPGNPYVAPHPGSKTQNGFASLGQPDIAATLAAVASEALKAVWYQKWWVHLRHRPESGGALVFQQKTGLGPAIQAQVSNTVLNSQAVADCFAANHSYFLSQAFPEGSPTHPAYPTGHGAVAGACITVLKFFFDGMQKFLNPQVPASNGGTLSDYVAPAGEPPLTVNGELHKLAHNVSFGHGIHAGIHWRSDTDTSIQLGEAVAISYLRDRVKSYNEKFSVTITKLDGTPETFTNP
jgi:hypothetical protein